MRTNSILSVETLETRSLLSVVTVLSGNEYHFTDSQGADQHVAVWGGAARVTLSDLSAGQHEIQAVQLFGRGMANVDFEASTNVPTLLGRRVGDVEIDGNLGSFRALSVWGDVDVAGNLREFRSVLVDSSVYVEGNLGSLLVGSFQWNDLFVEGDVTGRVQVLRSMGSIHVGLEYVEETDEYVPTGGLLRGSLRIGGDLDELHIAGSSETATATIGGDLETLEVAGDLAGSVHVIGSVYDAEIGGDLQAHFSVDGDLEYLEVGGNQPHFASLEVGGTAEDVEFTGDVAGKISLGELDCWLLVSGTLYGSVHIEGDAGEIAVGYWYNEETEELESTGAALFGSIDVGGSLYELELGGGSSETASITVVGDLEEFFSEGDVAGTIEVGGSVCEFDTWGQMLGSLFVAGDLEFFISGFGQSAESVIKVGGWVGGMEFGGDVDGHISAAEIDYVLIDGCLHGTIEGVDPDDIIEFCFDEFEPEE